MGAALCMASGHGRQSKARGWRRANPPPPAPGLLPHRPPSSPPVISAPRSRGQFRWRGSSFPWYGGGVRRVVAWGSGEVELLLPPRSKKSPARWSSRGGGGGGRVRYEGKRKHNGRGGSRGGAIRSGAAVAVIRSGGGGGGDPERGGSEGIVRGVGWGGVRVRATNSLVLVFLAPVYFADRKSVV